MRERRWRARKVYAGAGARNPAGITLAGVEAIQLDVTRPEDVAAAAKRCGDVTGFDVPKAAPDVVVRRTLDALEAGAEEVLADERARQVKNGLSAEPGAYLLAPCA